MEGGSRRGAGSAEEEAFERVVNQWKPILSVEKNNYFIGDFYSTKTKNMRKYDDKLFKGAKASVFENARHLRKELTEAEELLWQELRNRKLNGWKFRRQHPINHYVADFYCCEKRLVVEVDGSVHDEIDQKGYDEARTNDLASMGIHVLRFRNGEVEGNIVDVLRRIREFVDNVDKR